MDSNLQQEKTKNKKKLLKYIIIQIHKFGTKL